MSTIQFNTKQQFIDALEARRQWAEAFDRRVRKDHEAEERRVLTEFKNEARRLGKMSLSALKAEVESEESGYRGRLTMSCYPPRCPTSQVAQLDRAIARLAVTKQQTFRLSSGSDAWRTEYWLLTHDDTPTDLCG